MINGTKAGRLRKSSIYEFNYLAHDVEQPGVALSMPPSERLTWRDGALFAGMDQHLPEGDLLLRLSAALPRKRLDPMHLLAMIGANGIGRLGYSAANGQMLASPLPVDRGALLSMRFSQSLFDELVEAHWHTGSGIAGVQPKIMLADRAGAPFPTVIVKVAPIAYPGLVANEFLCLSAARRAGIETPGFNLSHDGQILVVDRFDLVWQDGGSVSRLGFEDIAALMNLRVRDVLGARKYQGSYRHIAELLQRLGLAADGMRRFFEQVAFSVMVRNGDAHLKNFGVLVPAVGPIRLSPLFDVATTAAYTYARFAGDAEQTDRTMALKLLSGRHHTRAYPTVEELLRFGTDICGVALPYVVLDRIAQAMHETLADARGDARISPSLLRLLCPIWASGMGYASTAVTER
ncbi:serine/threonine-protein kinase HipA [Pelomonas saccharophila]|uniref:Serine/threonine-protein kinase HipA n=1 Tax=Roseateles saccharophilus TaxID=304 RepID=A0ABU1YW99_ROSSA|nr:type II toxin-antitoxin system HipA family toxin [Roseateles saccharophilus]MDR7273123.1 serine/threonine-protein kinase HipA [Roseateles saccharophilus]